jgi:TRAP-type C4-dicarboxylate transport system permease small subunit
VSLPVELAAGGTEDVPTRGVLGALQAVLTAIDRLAILLSALAAAAAGLVLTWEVAGRYFFKIASDWQDELSTFLLIGATFLSAAWVQARRGHIGINALAALLPPRLDALRRRAADLATFAFCSFFAWKCWSLLREAIEDDQISGSAWGPPLWIPYGLMAVGMSLLVLQLALQLVDFTAAPTPHDNSAAPTPLDNSAAPAPR